MGKKNHHTHLCVENNHCTPKIVCIHAPKKKRGYEENQINIPCFLAFFPRPEKQSAVGYEILESEWDAVILILMSQFTK